MRSIIFRRAGFQVIARFQILATRPNRTLFPQIDASGFPSWDAHPSNASRPPSISAVAASSSPSSPGRPGRSYSGPSSRFKTVRPHVTPRATIRRSAGLPTSRPRHRPLFAPGMVGRASMIAPCPTSSRGPRSMTPRTRPTTMGRFAGRSITATS